MSGSRWRKGSVIGVSKNAVDALVAAIAVVVMLIIVSIAAAAVTVAAVTVAATAVTRDITYLETQRSVSSVRETWRMVRVGLIPIRPTCPAMVWEAGWRTVGWSLRRWLIFVT
jgi:hypothetical protein